MQFVAVRGKGNPNEEDGEYKSALALQYAIEYTIKMMDSFDLNNGWQLDFSEKRLHHEIYLSDPRKTPPEKNEDCYKTSCKEIKMKNELLVNIEKLHTTPMGLDRIRRNLRLGDDVKDVVAWCREKILDSNAVITRQGKNWYVKIEGCEFTVNAYSFTIITAHTMR